MVFCQRQLFLCLLYFSLNSWRWQTTLQTWFISWLLQIISFILSKRIILMKSKRWNWWSFIYVQNKNNVFSPHANGKMEMSFRVAQDCWSEMRSPVDIFLAGHTCIPLSYIPNYWILLGGKMRLSFLMLPGESSFFFFFQEKLNNLFISNKVIQLHNDSSLHKN